MNKRLDSTPVSYEAGKLAAVVEDARLGGEPRLLPLGEGATKEIGGAFGLPALNGEGILQTQYLPLGLRNVPAPATDNSDDGKALVVSGAAWALGTGAGGGGGGDSIHIVADSYTGTAKEKLDAAVADAIDDGKPLAILGDFSLTAALATISVPEGKRLDIVLFGSITIASEIPRAIMIEAAWPSPVSVTSLAMTTYTPAGGSVTECMAAVAPGHDIVAGDLVKLVADDPIPGEISTDRRVGENGLVIAVDGDTVYLGWRPVDAFTTGIRLQRRPRKTGVSFTGPGKIKHAPGLVTTNALTVRGFSGAVIDTDIFDGSDCGLQTQSCILSKFRTGGWNFKNTINTAGASGYVHQDACGWLNEIEAYGADARHFFTTTSLTTTAGGATYQYGRSIGLSISGAGIGSTSAAYDLHPDAYDCTIHDAKVTGGMAGEAGSGAGFQIRGRKNKVVDCSVTGGTPGIQFWAQVEGDGQDLAVRNFDYNGTGDAFRIGSQASGVLVKRAKIYGGRSTCDNIRSFYATRCERAIITGHTFEPIGVTSGANAITLNSEAEVWAVRCTLDLTNYTGSAYDFVSLSSGITGCTIVLVAPNIIDPNNKLRSWVNASGTSGNTIRLLGLPEDAVLSGDVLANNTGGIVPQIVGSSALTASALTAVINGTIGSDEGLDADLAAAIIAVLEEFDSSRLFSRDGMLDEMEGAASDLTTDGPRMAGAVMDALATASAAALKSGFGAFYPRMGYIAPVLMPSVADEDILAASAMDGSGLRQVIGVAPETIAPVPDSFLHVASDGEVDSLPAAAFLALLQTGLPFASSPVTPVSNVLSYDAGSNPNAYVATPVTANLVLNPSIWNSISERMWGGMAKLTIPVGGTARTIDIATTAGGTQTFPSDGMDPFIADATSAALPFTMPANSIVKFGLGRHMGGKPFIELLKIGYSANVPIVSYVGYATPYASGTPLGARSIASTPSQVGDRIVCIAYNGGGTTAPTFDASYTVVSGIGDGISGNPTVASKVCTVAGEGVACGSATQLHAIVFRKAGGTPQIQSTVGWWRGGFPDTTSSWPAFTVTNKGLVLALHGFVSTDSPGSTSGTPNPALRSEVGTELYNGITGSNGRLYIGVSNVVNAATDWGATTTIKSGGAGRAWTAQIAIY